MIYDQMTYYKFMQDKYMLNAYLEPFLALNSFAFFAVWASAFFFQEALSASLSLPHIPPIILAISVIEAS